MKKCRLNDISLIESWPTYGAISQPGGGWELEPLGPFVFALRYSPNPRMTRTILGQSGKKAYGVRRYNGTSDYLIRRILTFLKPSLYSNAINVFNFAPR